MLILPVLLYGGIFPEGNMAERIGFIGLGKMGHGMAANLVKAFPVTGWDVEPSRFQGLGEVRRAASVAELARESTCVCLSLPGAHIVEDVCVGRDGIAERLSPGSLVVDLSTSLPSTSRRIAARLAEKGIQFADAPVSGGEAGARDGTLAIMVGAPAAVYDRAQPVLKAMGGSVVRVGDVGAGGVAKLVNNMVVAATFAVIAEGFALAERNGIDLQVLYESIRGGWA
ncbi:MAG TPA: NAD(P)-binding domain-containing protein, partial [bacterium]|nr:NAD(P)-binding domain-containing protein [bacterium]